MPSVTTTDLTIRRAFEADASGLRLVPEAVARPTEEVEVVEVLREATAARTPVTAAGAQSSTTGASITETGVLLSMRSYDRVLDIDPFSRTVRVQAGALIGDVKRAVGEVGLTWAPDPTSEQECTVGGAIACNASGARTLVYGPARAHVRMARVAMADGQVMEFRRSAVDKNTAGYGITQDPLDWFIGSEGTLGVLLEAELALVPIPEHVVGLAIPFRTESGALDFVAAARQAGDLSPRCLEYFDTKALEIARAADGNRFKTPAGATLVYAEQACTNDAVLDAWFSHADAHGAIVDDLVVFDGEAALVRARAMRHAVPAAMNELGARLRPAGGRKVSTDWAVPYQRLAQAIAEARAIAAHHGLSPAVTYGHAGNGHPHQNYLARDADELQLVERVIEESLVRVIAMRGTIAAEHGIGKLKRRWLPLQLTALQLAMMRTIKRELDPHNLLAPGNIL